MCDDDLLSVNKHRIFHLHIHIHKRLKYITYNVLFFSCFLFQGEVELENLPLKKDALRHFGLPIKAYSGSIGKIKLQIPVRQFRSAPWCISIEDVYIVSGPINLDEVSSN